MTTNTKIGLSYGTKRVIAGRAQTLEESLANDDVSGDVLKNAHSVLKQWKEGVANGNEAMFERRLDGFQLTETEALLRIRHCEWPSDRELPGWITDLEELCTGVSEGPRDRNGCWVEDTGTVPFKHITATLVEVAEDRLCDICPPEVVSQGVLTDFRNWLANRLGNVMSQCLFIEYRTYLLSNCEGVSLEADSVPSELENSTRYRQKFASEYLLPNLPQFFKEYSFLGRLVTTLISNWEAAITEFYDRIQKDESLISNQLLEDGSNPRITGIKPRGDPHNNGRQVLEVTFDSGERVAYKPRNVGPEEAFSEFTDWVDETLPAITLESPSVINRDSYGWVEWVSTSDCESQMEVKEYYRRAGALIAICHALRFTDGHLENVIANRAMPQLVDLETILVPSDPFHAAFRSDSLSTLIEDSVLRTGFVPRYEPKVPGNGFNGFGSSTAQIEELQLLHFSHESSDAIDLSFESEAKMQGDNLATVSNSEPEPEEYLDEIISGFELAYEHLLDNKTTLLNPEGPLRSFKEARIRVVLRSTATYYRVISTVTSPEYLRTGLKFGCRCEELAEPLLANQHNGVLWDLYCSERRALTQLDIPRFSASATRTELGNRPAKSVDAFPESPMTQVKKRIDQLSKDDLDKQLYFLKIAYGETYVPSDEFGEHQMLQTDEFTVQSRDDVLELCNAIKTDVIDAAEEVDGIPQWYLRQGSPFEGARIRDIDDWIFEGRTGIALFAAALYQQTDDPKCHELLEKATSPVVTGLEAGYRDEVNIGGYTGLGSLVYGFLTISRISGSDYYLNQATRAADLITKTRIESDTKHDLLAGSAGALLSLLRLYDETGTEEYVRKARFAGEQLLASATERNGVMAWDTGSEGPPLAGFAHGTAGIAYALYELSQYTDEPQYRKNALESLKYENEQYDASHGNWGDLRPKTESDFMVGWCHGRPGIGIGRIAMQEAGGSTVLDRVKRDVGRAVANTIPGHLQSFDHVCHGNFSSVELLLCADEQEAAAQLANATSNRGTVGAFNTEWSTNHWRNPTFFTGLAGIGYSLLRFHDSSLPSVLMLE